MAARILPEVAAEPNVAAVGVVAENVGAVDAGTEAEGTGVGAGTVAGVGAGTGVESSQFHRRRRTHQLTGFPHTCPNNRRWDACRSTCRSLDDCTGSADHKASGLQTE